MKKFRLTENKKEWFGITLYQIESLINFGNIHVGDKGGWVEKEENLSHSGDAWVYGNAEVFGNAFVCGNAKVYGNAEVYGNAKVSGNALVCGNAEVSGNALVYGNAKVYGNNSIMWISKVGSRLGTTTAFTNKDGGITVTCGCFIGSLEEFEKKAEQTHGDNKFGKEYKALITLIKIHFDKE